MALTVSMPQLGESVTEGTIARWLKQPGEMVSKFESIAEVVTDKVNAEIPAPADGSMGEHIAKEGEVISVGQPICTIETTEQAQQNSAWAQPSLEETPPVSAESATGNGSGSQPTVAEPQPAVAAMAGANSVTQVAQRPPVDTSGYHLTPAVRALLREHSIDPARLSGSGLGGRITKRDVLDYIGTGAEPIAVASHAAPPAPAPTVPVAAPAAPAAVPAELGTGDQLIPMTPMRRAIAEHMVRSKQTSPHAWLMVEVDMTPVARLRQRMKQEFRARYGVGLTFLPFVARATCDALRELPTMNSTWSDDGLIAHRDIHLGIAVALEDNLIVPVVRHADRLSISGLATTMSELAERARGNRLKLDEIQGGTFTLNNTGALGTVLTQPIINQPQAGILAMDSVVKRPVVVEGDAIAVRSMMNLCLSFDHRVVDGLQAAGFVNAVKRRLEAMGEDTLL